MKKNRNTHSPAADAFRHEMKKFEEEDEIRKFIISQIDNMESSREKSLYVSVEQMNKILPPGMAPVTEPVLRDEEITREVASQWDWWKESEREIESLRRITDATHGEHLRWLAWRWSLNKNYKPEWKPLEK